MWEKAYAFSRLPETLLQRILFFSALLNAFPTVKRDHAVYKFLRPPLLIQKHRNHLITTLFQCLETLRQSSFW